jgi:hypothetical protein
VRFSDPESPGFHPGLLGSKAPGRKPQDAAFADRRKPWLFDRSAKWTKARMALSTEIRHGRKRRKPQDAAFADRRKPWLFDRSAKWTKARMALST